MNTPTQSRRKSAVQKRDGAAEPVVKVLTEAKSAAFPAGRMLIPSPRAVADVIEAVPHGQLLTMSTLRKTLARTYHADYSCPITTGIFVRIVADAAEEERLNGAPTITPWWRLVRDDGSLFEKLPGGAARQAALLTAEGHLVEDVCKVRALPASPV